MKHTIVAAVATLLFVAVSQAGEPFKIPHAQAKELVGEWKVVKMGDGEKLEPAPEGRYMGMVFRADGSGLQKKGPREIPIIWGADDKGAFAAQWKKPDGNGDGIMGTWKVTEDGLLLRVQEFEDGKGPGEDRFTLLMQRTEAKG